MGNYAQEYGHKWWDLHHPAMDCFPFAVSKQSWNQQDLNEIIKTDKDFNYIYKFEIEIQNAYLSLGIGVLAQQQITANYKYVYKEYDGIDECIER